MISARNLALMIKTAVRENLYRHEDNTILITNEYWLVLFLPQAKRLRV